MKELHLVRDENKIVCPIDPNHKVSTNIFGVPVCETCLRFITELEHRDGLVKHASD